MNNYVITIARGFGSGGKFIGKELSKILGIPCYDEEILNMASEYSGINKSYFNKVDEKLKKSGVLKNILAIKPLEYIAGPTEKKFTSDVNLFNIQKYIMEELSAKKSCIIIGKCANHILQKKPNVLSVYIEAPRSVCRNNVMEQFGVDEDEADKLIYRTDKYRSDYYEYYTGGEKWTNPVFYDMTINTGRLGRQQSIEIIRNSLNIKMGKEVTVQ